MFTSNIVINLSLSCRDKILVYILWIIYVNKYSLLFPKRYIVTAYFNFEEKAPTTNNIRNLFYATM